MESRKMVLMNLMEGQQWIHTENRPMDKRGDGGKRGRGARRK